MISLYLAKVLKTVLLLCCMYIMCFCNHLHRSMKTRMAYCISRATQGTPQRMIHGELWLEIWRKKREY